MSLFSKPSLDTLLNEFTTLDSKLETFIADQNTRVSEARAKIEALNEEISSITPEIHRAAVVRGNIQNLLAS